MVFITTGWRLAVPETEPRVRIHSAPSNRQAAQRAHPGFADGLTHGSAARWPANCHWPAHFSYSARRERAGIFQIGGVQALGPVVYLGERRARFVVDGHRLRGRF